LAKPNDCNELRRRTPTNIGRKKVRGRTPRRVVLGELASTKIAPIKHAWLFPACRGQIGERGRSGYAACHSYHG
jgi:hypothetical protein